MLSRISATATRHNHGANSKAAGATAGATGAGGGAAGATAGAAGAGGGAGGPGEVLRKPGEAPRRPGEGGAGGVGTRGVVPGSPGLSYSPGFPVALVVLTVRASLASFAAPISHVAPVSVADLASPTSSVAPAFPVAPFSSALPVGAVSRVSPVAVVSSASPVAMVSGVSRDDVDSVSARDLRSCDRALAVNPFTRARNPAKRQSRGLQRLCRPRGP
jgi:hypothetical protein